MATVDALITDARNYAETTMDAADGAIQEMQDQIANIGFTAISFTGLTLPDAPDLPIPIDVPTLTPVDLTLPTEPAAAPLFQDISTVEPGAAPVLTASAPTVNLPSAPAQLAEFAETVPLIKTDYTFPEVPAALVDPLIAEPTLGNYVVPTAPTVALPSFDAVAPVDTTTPPTDFAAQFNAAYRDSAPLFVSAVEGQMDAWMSRHFPQHHTQLAAIEAKLTAYLQGGSGLSPAVEDQIYARSAAKQAAEARRAESAAFEAAAARGFTMPTGAALASIRASRQAAADNNAASAREIVVMQAEMEQKNLQFALTTSIGLRNAALSAMLNYHGNLVALNGQALQYASTALSAIIQVYNLTLEQFRVKLAAYQAEVAVFEARLKAALSLLDLYRAEIDALQAMVQVDQARVAVYRGRIDALEALANVYRSRVQTVVEQASLEKLKVDLFKTKTEAYMATVQGKRAEYDAYAAAINGEEAKVRIFGSQVQAFNAQVTGYKAQIESQVEVVRAQALTNESRGANYRAVLAGYQTIAQTRGEVARVKLENQRQEINAFEVAQRAQITYAQIANDNYRTRADILIRNAVLEVDTLIKNADLNLGRTKAAADVGVASAKVYEGILGAVMSSQNTLVAQTLAE
jgi:hypothetical protein